MTAQIPDYYSYKGIKYTIVAASKEELFDPLEYGLVCDMSSTACRRGYWCEFEIRNNGIYLENLYLYNPDNIYPPFNGVTVSPQEFRKSKYFKIVGDEAVEDERMVPINDGHRTYAHVNFNIPYSGKLLMGNGFIDDYYIHMGFQQGWAYKELIEFEFDDGKIIRQTDYSKQAEQKRKMIDQYGDDTEENIFDWIDDSFSLRYESKTKWIRFMEQKNENEEY